MILTVGKNGQFATPQEAYLAAQPGDIVEIDAASTYFGEAAMMFASGTNSITFRGVNGKAKMEVDDSVPLMKGKGIWVINAYDIVIENIEFTGATLEVDKNGAGIRLDPEAGGKMQIRNCFFHHNDNGILGGYNRTLDLLIEHCEFCYNGYGDGYSHNMYIGMAKSFTLRYSYTHHVDRGHLIKSRAFENYIEYNRITHEDTDEDFRPYNSNIDLPQGGKACIVGNLLHQGPKGRRFMISFAKENQQNPGKTCYIVNNTIVNYSTEGSFLHCPVEGYEMKAVNNIFIGNAPLTAGQADWYLENNLTADDPELLVDVARYDYRLKDNNNKEPIKSIDPGVFNGYTLLPDKQYVHKCSFENRKNDFIKVGALD